MTDRLLVACGAWHQGRRAFGASATAINLTGPLEALGVDVVRFHPDQWLEGRPGGDVGAQLVRQARFLDWPPILLSWEGWGGWVPWETLQRLRSHGCRVGVIWWDVSGELARVPVEAADLHIVHHGRHVDLAERRGDGMADRMLLHWFAHDPRVFYAPEVPDRDLGVVFSGARRDDERTAGVEALRYTLGADFGCWLTETGDRAEFGALAARLRRAKIVVNWPGGLDGYEGGAIDQHKGRCMEAMRCGAMLLERENDETSRWLRPGVDYASFTCSRNLCARVRYFLGDGAAERERIASTGAARMRDDYSAAAWWAPIRRRLCE